MQGLTPKQQKAISALLDQPTLKEAAAASSVNESTLWRWLQDEGFQQVYRQARGQLLESTLTALQSASGLAVETLRAVMEDQTAQPSARVSAAKAVLELGLKGREILEVEERLRALEERLTAQPLKGVKTR
jgi:hypothetical protein